MPIPQETLAVQRPSSTVVKQRGERYVVIKRNSASTATKYPALLL